MLQLLTIALILTIITPLVLHFGVKLNGKKIKKVLGLNLVSFFGIMLIMTVLIFTGSVGAEGAAQAPKMGDLGMGLGYLAAALVTGLASIGAGIAVSSAASAALGAISEDSSIMGKALIFVALAEGIALYGLLVTFSILGRL